MANLIDSALAKIRELASSYTKRQLLGPTQQQVNNPGNEIARGIAQGVRNVFEPYAQTLGEAGYQATRFATNPTYRKAILTGGQGMSPEELQKASQFKTSQFLKPEQISNRSEILKTGSSATGKALIGAYGLTAGAPQLAGTALLGGGIQAAFAPQGQRLQAFGQGIGEAPLYSGAGKFSQDVTTRLVGKFAGKAPLLTSRIGQGAVNVGENIGFDIATGRNPLDPTNLGLSFITGAAGKPFQTGSVKANFRLDKLTMDEVVQAEDMILNPKRYLSDLGSFATRKAKEKAEKDALKQIQKQASETLDRIAGKYLPDDILNKVAGDSKKTIKALVDLNNTNGLANVANFTDTKTALRAKPDFEAEMDALQKQELLPKNIFGQNDIEMKNIEDRFQKGSAMAAAGAPKVSDDFARWVNTRRASNIEGVLKGKDFEVLDAKGQSGFLDVQAGLKKNEFKQLRSYFDNKYQELKNAGIPIRYQEDYLPQLWKNKDEEVQQVFGRNLTTKPSFTLEKLIEDYKAGIDAGLTPRFERISDLVKWYESRANKALADVGYFKGLSKDGLIAPSGKAPQDWVTLNPDRFPKYKVNLGSGQSYTGTYKAPAELAQKINNYLKEPEGNLQKVADYASAAKNRMLSFGIPGTAINAHGFNILARSFMQDPIKGTYQGVRYMLNPSSAGKYLDQNLSKAPFAIKSGLTFSSSEYKSVDEQLTKNFRTQLGEKWNEMFEQGLFDKMIPALKLQKFYDLYEGYKKSLPEDEAARQAARFTNNLFGGFNWQELGKSPDWQNILRVTFLAPDWLRTNVNLAGNAAKSVTTGITDPRLGAYRKFAATFLGTYATMNAINKIQSGHWMFENDPGHKFEIDTDSYTPDGQKRYLRVFGTAADFARVPLDVAASLAQGDPSQAGTVIRNRLSVLAQPALSALTNTDYLGNPLFGRDKYGGTMTPAQNIAGATSLAGPLLGFPSFLQSTGDVITGKKGLEQGTVAALELPLRYKGGAYTTVQKQVAPLVSGQTGKSKFDLNNKLRGQTKFSDNQLEYIRSAPSVEQGVNDIIQKREVTATLNKLKSALEDGDEVEVNRLQRILDTVVSNTSAAEISPEVQTIAAQKIKDQINKARVEASGESLNSDGKFYYINENGSVVSVETQWELPKLDLTGSSGVDKTLVSSFKSKLTARQKDVMTLWEQGQINQDQAIDEYEKLESLKKTATNITAKPKKISVPKFSVAKPAKLKAARMPKINLRSSTVTPLRSKNYKFRKKI